MARLRYLEHTFYIAGARSMTINPNRTPEFSDTVLQAPQQPVQQQTDFDLGCALCGHDPFDTQLVQQTGSFRIVRVLDAAFPAYYRLVWQHHVTEFTQTSAAERQAMMAAVADIEATLLAVLTGPLRPSKINLASLGNAVPHLHWHIVARYDWDTHFPRSIWAEAMRAPNAAKLEALQAALSEIDRRLSARFSPDIAL